MDMFVKLYLNFTMVTKHRNIGKQETRIKFFNEISRSRPFIRHIKMPVLCTNLKICRICVQILNSITAQRILIFFETS